jgi:hypothetical protein
MKPFIKKIFRHLFLPRLYADPDSFRQCTSSCKDRKPKTFVYRYIRPGGSNVLPFILLENSNILQWKQYPAKQYYGWLSESSLIIEKTISLILKNIAEYEKGFCKIFTSDQRLIQKSPCFEEGPNGSTLPWVRPIADTFKKSRLLSIIASDKQETEGHLLRDQAIRAYHPIDVFGHGRKNIKTKEEALQPYYFSVCVENGKYPNYFTEKITDCFASKTIPIYWGNPNIGDIFDLKGILLYGETERLKLSSSLYSEMLPHVENNFRAVSKLVLPDDIIFQKMKTHLSAV